MSAYTEKMVAEMVDHGAWTYAEAVDFAAENGLKPRSVIAKIKSLGLEYTPKPTRVNKRNEPVVKKAQLVEAIEAALQISTPSLLKVGKADLERVVTAVGAEMPEPEAN